MLKVFSKLTREQVTFILIWSIAILAIGITAGLRIIKTETDNLTGAIKTHKERIDPTKTEGGKTAAETNPPPGVLNDPQEVKIGIYVDRIAALSMKDSSWTVDFYIWFTWTNDKWNAKDGTGDDLRPGEAFQVVGGQIQTKELVEEKDLKSGEHYAMYRVIATITKAFNTSRFPRDDHLLTIHIEDTKRPFYELRYVADTMNSSVSSRVNVTGYESYNKAYDDCVKKYDNQNNLCVEKYYNIDDKKAVVKLHSYKTTRGDADLPKDYMDTYSQFIYGIWIKRPSWGLHIKMFLTLFAAVLIPMFGFFTNPNHRLGVVVGSFFASVASTYITSAVVPDAGIATLADVISGIGIVTIAIIMIQTIIAQYFFEKTKEEDYVFEENDEVLKAKQKQAYLAEKHNQANFTDAYDFATFIVLFGLYVWLNIAIPVAATITPAIFSTTTP